MRLVRSILARFNREPAHVYLAEILGDHDVYVTVRGN